LILLASRFRFVSSLVRKILPPSADKPSYYLYSTSVSFSFNSLERRGFHRSWRSGALSLHGAHCSMANFQNLRKFDAPQEAFFSRSKLGKNFTACQLPAAIEQVTIRHATLAAGRWARYMHIKIHIFTNLKAITLWSNDMPRGHASRPSWHQLKVAGIEIVFRRYGDDSVTIL
jgi:hypothetical protein